MTVVQVVRLRPNDKWTFGLLDRILDGTLWRVPGVEYEVVEVPEQARRGEPAVVILPGEEWARRVPTVNRYLSRFSRVVVIVVADEGSTFPWRDLDLNSRSRLWIQTPRPGVHPPGAAHYIGFGWRYDTPDVIRRFGRRPRDHSFFFAGQITHGRRYELVTALEGLDDPLGVLIQTQAFGTGLERDSYLEEVVRARWIPCPSGPVCPDSFRLYEALEGGAVPIVDAECPGYPDGVTGSDYWRLVYREDAALLRPTSDWSTLPGAISPEWPAQISGWWQRLKRSTAWRLRDDALDDAHDTLVEGITAIVTTAPLPSAPSLYHLERTIDSIRERLPEVEIIVTADGWRDGAACSREAYLEYLETVVYRCEHEWTGVVPLLSPRWIHQANTTRAALDLVRTSTVLFLEHDTPLVGECPWPAMVDAIATGEAHVVRLSSEATILEPWRHLYLDETPVEVAGVPLLRTVQWSSRPHLVETEWYRETLRAYFGDDSRTYTEDVLHRALAWTYHTRGEDGWRDWRVWTYAPAGDLKRSTHTDGRDGASKGRLTFAYPATGRPVGAPRPSREDSS